MPARSTSCSSNIRLGTDSGFAALSDVAAGASRAALPAVIVLTAYDYPQLCRSGVEPRAAGFVLKTAPTPRIGRRDPAGRRRWHGLRGPATNDRASTPDPARTRRRPARRRRRSNERDRRHAGDRVEDGRDPPVTNLRTVRHLVARGNLPREPFGKAGWMYRRPAEPRQVRLATTIERWPTSRSLAPGPGRPGFDACFWPPEGSVGPVMCMDGITRPPAGRDVAATTGIKSRGTRPLARRRLG